MMAENLAFLAAPITASILMAVILGYFGNHILTRGIIFIDIAVAQIAALGTMIGLLLGFAEESKHVLMFSYAFTVLVLGLFSLTKFRKQLIPQEAIIGILYCIGLGLALLLAEQIPGGSNYITKTISGNLLWATWPQIVSCVILFAVIGGIHGFMADKFLAISNTKNGLPFSAGKVRLYEFIFYVTFGVVIVKAVPIGGIFFVFTLLIAPAATARLFTRNWRKGLLWTWLIGTLGSVIGMYLSYNWNISNGPTIVCLLGIVVFLAAMLKLALPYSKTVKS